jgi:hypothetical protein
MVQVLPYQPSFGEQLGPVLQQAMQNVQQGFQNRRDQQILQGLGNPALSPMQQIQAFGSLSPQRQQFLGPLIKEQIKLAPAQQEKAQQVQNMQTAFKELESLVDVTGPFGLGHYGSERHGQRERFDTQAFWLTDQVYTHFNKGQISDKKLKLIREQLAPKSSLSIEQNKARLDALRRVMNLPPDMEKDKVNSIVDKEIKSTKSGKSPDVALIPKGEAAPPAASAPDLSKKVSTTPGKTWVISPKGNKVEIPDDQLQAALSSGGKLYEPTGV